MGQPDLVSLLKDVFVSVFIKGLVTDECFDVGGQIFNPATVNNFSAAFALNGFTTFT